MASSTGAKEVARFFSIPSKRWTGSLSIKDTWLGNQQSLSCPKLRKKHCLDNTFSSSITVLKNLDKFISNRRTPCSEMCSIAMRSIVVQMPSVACNFLCAAFTDNCLAPRGVWGGSRTIRSRHKETKHRLYLCGRLGLGGFVLSR